MSWLKLVPAWCWWILALLVVAGAQEIRIGSAQAGTSTAQRELAGYRLEVSERDRRAAAQARTEEQRRQVLVDEADRRANERYVDLEGRAAAAESRAVGMRGEIARLRAGHRATCDTITAQQRQAGESAIVVLGRLLEESDRMAGSSTAALERSRIAGQACEVAYDALSHSYPLK